MAKKKDMAEIPAQATANDKAARKPKASAAAKPVDRAAGGKVSLGDRFGQLKEFFEQSKVEIKKVTWPTRKETVTTSIAVLVLVVVMSVYLGVVDVALSKLVQFILS